VLSDGSSDYNGVGGIVGSAINITISNSYNRGYIQLDTAEEADSSPSVGGVVGFAFVSSITNTYNQGNISQDIGAMPGTLGVILGKVSLMMG
jgi:hypothetical protein